MMPVKTHLDSDLLRTFLTIAETHSFTKAAEQLFRTQSAISMQMKRLEQLVGGALFERGSRGVELTRKGHELAGSARRIVSLLDDTAAQMTAAPLSGTVRIGIPEDFSYAVLARALAAFSKRHRNVEVDVWCGMSASNRAKLTSGQLDLAVVCEWTGVDEGEILLHDPSVWVTSDLYNTHEERPMPVALYMGGEWLHYAKRSLDMMAIEHQVMYRADTTGGLLLAVQSGLAIAPLSRSNVPPGCRALSPAEGFAEIDSANVRLLRSPAALGPAVDSMAQAIRDAFAGSVAGSSAHL